MGISTRWFGDMNAPGNDRDTAESESIHGYRRKHGVSTVPLRLRRGRERLHYSRLDDAEVRAPDPGLDKILDSVWALDVESESTHLD